MIYCYRRLEMSYVSHFTLFEHPPVISVNDCRFQDCQGLNIRFYWGYCNIIEEKRQLTMHVRKPLGGYIWRMAGITLHTTNSLRIVFFLVSLRAWPWNQLCPYYQYQYPYYYTHIYKNIPSNISVPIIFLDNDRLACYYSAGSVRVRTTSGPLDLLRLLESEYFKDKHSASLVF